MRRVFADTVYWITLANPLDQWHRSAAQASRTLGGTEIVTTEEVLTEFLAHFSGRGRAVRAGAVRYAERIMANPDIVVRPQSHASFAGGFALYKARPDKGNRSTQIPGPGGKGNRRFLNSRPERGG
jgi:hypothetical protein